MSRHDDDLTPPPPPLPLVRSTVLDLEPMSVEALTAYIADLEAEIARARAAIARKGGVRSAAEALFKK